MLGDGVRVVEVQELTSATAGGVNGNLVLRKALQRAGEELGLSAQETAQAIGKSRTFFEQARAQSRIDLHTQRMIALPREQLQDPEQLVELVHYLDAMRGRP